MPQKELHSAETTNNTYNHVLKYTSLFGGVQGITILLSIIRNKFVSVLLGSVGLALIDIYNYSMNLISSVTQFGIPTTAVRNLSELYEKGNEEEMRDFVKVMRSWSLLTALLGLLTCTIFSFLISRLSFGNYDYTWQFVLLSPIVAMLAISGVEIAILKALRRLKTLALATMIGAVSTLFLTIPFYFFFGLKGIVPALVLSTFSIMLINLHFTLKLFRWEAQPFSVSTLKKGTSMIRLGLSFILAGFVASAAEMLIRSFIVKEGSLAEAGLYTAGFTLTVAYSRFVFVSMDADYFPRLSGICNDSKKMNQTINLQIQVSVLLIAPFLIIFDLLLPQIIPILFQESFIAAVDMALMATFYMFFKAATAPIAYTALAKNDSIVYLLMESIYYIVFVFLVMWGYHTWGLWGAGLALSLSNLFDLLMISTVYYVRYHFRYSLLTVVLFLSQALLVIAGIWLSGLDIPIYKYGIGFPVFIVSTILSFAVLMRSSSLHESLKSRLQKFQKGR